MAYADRPIGILTIACEASNQSHECKQAIAAVLFNRLHHGGFGKSIAAVCFKRYAFSEYNDDIGDNANLIRVASMLPDDPVILDSAVAYDEAAAGADPSLGATHFYADSISQPSWAALATFTVKIGNVLFFKNVP